MRDETLAEHKRALDEIARLTGTHERGTYAPADLVDRVRGLVELRDGADLLAQHYTKIAGDWPERPSSLEIVNNPLANQAAGIARKLRTMLEVVPRANSVIARLTKRLRDAQAVADSVSRQLLVVAHANAGHESFSNEVLALAEELHDKVVPPKGVDWT